MREAKGLRRVTPASCGSAGRPTSRAPSARLHGRASFSKKEERACVIQSTRRARVCVCVRVCANPDAGCVRFAQNTTLHGGSRWRGWPAPRGAERCDSEDVGALAPSSLSCISHTARLCRVKEAAKKKCAEAVQGSGTLTHPSKHKARIRHLTRIPLCSIHRLLSGPYCLDCLEVREGEGGHGRMHS